MHSPNGETPYEIPERSTMNIMITKRKIIAWSIFAFAVFIALYPFTSVERVIECYPSVNAEYIAKFYYRGYVCRWYYTLFAVIIFFVAMILNKDEE